jgi:hypothetical protein
MPDALTDSGESSDVRIVDALLRRPWIAPQIILSADHAATAKTAAPFEYTNSSGYTAHFNFHGPS